MKKALGSAVLMVSSLVAPTLTAGAMAQPSGSAAVEVREGRVNYIEVVGGRFPTAEMFVYQAYQDVLGRPPDSAGLAFWAGLIEAGTPPDVLLSELVGSEEFGGTVAPVARLYYSVFDRAPDLEGLRFWVAQRRAGATWEQLAQAFIDSDEFEALNNAADDSEVIEAVYAQVLGRQPDAAGLAYWLDLVSSGQLSVPGFVVAVSESVEHQNRRNALVTTTTVYVGLLQRLPDSEGVDYWSELIDQGLALNVFIQAVISGQEYLNRFPARAPTPNTSVVASGFTIPWDVVGLDDGSKLVSERPGAIQLVAPDGSVTTVAADLDDLFASGETGLMGLAVDANFETNRRFYSCQGHLIPREIQVIAWTLAADGTSATRVADPLVSGLPLASGRHGGCQLTIDADGALLIGTGDAAVGSTPQSLTSLGGKVLRVNASTGNPMPDNPFVDSANPSTRLIYSLGHRNVQGVAIHPDTGAIWTVEHGPNRDDEINQIVAGGNYGWNPVPGYNEAVPMTDLARFPNAVSARFSTGAPTLAISGADFLAHPSWGSWRGGLAVAALKNRTLRLYFFSPEGQPLGSRVLISQLYGRLRAVNQAPDGTLLVTTSNGSGSDQIIQITP